LLPAPTYPSFSPQTVPVEAKRDRFRCPPPCTLVSDPITLHPGECIFFFLDPFTCFSLGGGGVSALENKCKSQAGFGRLKTLCPPRVNIHRPHSQTTTLRWPANCTRKRRIQANIVSPQRIMVGPITCFWAQSVLALSIVHTRRIRVMPDDSARPPSRLRQLRLM